MKIKIFTILIIVSGIVVFTSCEKYRCIDGSGRIVTEIREVADFTGVSSGGDYDVYIEQNDSNYYEVEIEADARFMAYISTSVRSNTLEIRNINDRCLDGARVIVYIKVPELLYVNLSGSGYIEADCKDLYNKKMSIVHSGSGKINVFGINTDELETKLSGSGAIELDGKVNIHDMVLSGSGKVKAYPLDSNESYVDIPGSGDVYVFAFDYLDILISGSGNVFYRGNPDLNIRITGSGYYYNNN